MAKPTSINISNSDTLRVLDEYCKTRKTSRSSAICALLDATVPILKDITNHVQLADELNKRLLSGVYKQGIIRRRNTVAAERYCLEIWNNNLHVKNEYEFDSANHNTYLRSKKPHYRRDKRLGKVENRHINDICSQFILREKSPAKYVCFVYVQRVFIPEKDLLKKFDHPANPNSPLVLVAGDAVILLAKDVFCDGYFFDLSKALIIDVVDLIPSGISGITKTLNEPNAYCWIPILYSGSITVIVPVFEIDPDNASKLKKPNAITIVYRTKE
ncbi:TPA: hypothetical protein P2Q98_004534 [Aeromonas veronii]|uniref:hypothetical protein n=1 Tax=Aeromonas veronii TaxID=654 RepID=UPI003310A663|nr:hypothetical protein [Aeromonas veronii]HDO1336263.1 hypothetical protein [Aeromonas veronii]HDO1340784.1 hypothetical protein [Aeromonas veronii]HDO1345311.1 hypothetical protein [Aeromonas veronii]HDO1349886.1 hypothetical protein [Aeromonas veronii]